MMNSTEQDMKSHLKGIDIIIAAIYFVVISIILYGSWYSLISQSVLNKLIGAVNIGFPMYLFLWYFDRLKVWSIFILWFVIGIMHLVISIYLTNTGEFKSVVGNYSDGGLTILTALFALLFGHCLNLLIFKRGFVGGAWFSPDSVREKDYFDIVITLIGMAAIILSFTFGIKYP